MGTMQPSNSRALHQDFEDGSDANKFAYDVTTHGPVLRMVIRF